MEYFGKSRNGDYRRYRPNQEYLPDNPGKGQLHSSRKTTPSDTFENLNGNADKNSQRTRSIDETVNGSGPRNLPLGSSNVFYGYGGPFRLDYDTDGSSEMDSSLDFKIQPWMDKITGGTFKRNYIDRVSFRPSLHHDSQNRMDNIRQFGKNERISDHDDSKESKYRAKVTIFLVILGIILIGGIAGVLAYFLSLKDNGDSSISYYVATGEMTLDEIFYEELSNSSSLEFKNLSSEFCGAITEALQNSTENGDKYKLCEVIDFRNGSIKVRFKVYYVYTTTVVITPETVKEDLNSSLISKDANRAQLSTLIIIKVSLKITVEIETFQLENDPVASSFLPSTTATPTAETSTIQTTVSVSSTSPSTTPVATTVLATTTPPSSTTLTNIQSPTTTASTTTPQTTKTSTTITTSFTPTMTATTTKTLTTSQASTALTTTAPTVTLALTTSTTKTTPTNTASTITMPTSTTAQSDSNTTITTKPTAKSTTETIPTTTTTTKSSISTTQTVTTQTTTTNPTTTTTLYITTTPTTTEFITTQMKSTTESSLSSEIPETTKQQDYTTETTTLSSVTLRTTLESTTNSEIPKTTTQDDRTNENTTLLSTTTTTTGESSTDSETLTSSTVIEMSTERSESTLPLTTETIESSSESTKSTTKATEDITTYMPSSIDRTTPMTAAGTKSTLNSASTTETTLSTLQKMEESTTQSSTEKISRTTGATGNDTSDSTTSTIPATSWIMESTYCDECTSESAVESTTESLKNNTTQTTIEITSAALLEYTADVKVSDVIGIIGEITSAQLCRITPQGDWLYVSVSIDYNQASNVIEKIHYNQTVEKPAFVDRFSTSSNMNGDDIIVTLTLNLTEPTADLCSWDGRYTVSCFVIMNDTFHTKISNGSRIPITGPMSEISIDSELQYNEGDQLSFNCSTKVDPNYSTVHVEFIKDTIRLGDLPGPEFGSDKNANCTVDFKWAARAFRLTPKENGVMVRCLVTNTLLNKTKFAEKKLNVSSADVGFTKYSYRNLTKSFQEVECIARNAQSVLQNLTISKDDVEIAFANSSDTAIKLISSTRHSISTLSYNGDVRLIVRISNVECEDQGIYRCILYKKDNSSSTSPDMSFIVEGARPTLSLNADIFEPFARKNYNHFCSTEHTGDESSHKYLEVQIYIPNNDRSFKYSSKIPESEKFLNPEDQLTYINITGTSAQFLLVSNQKNTSSCNKEETITFLLDLTMEFNNGIIKCVLTDGMNEYASVESKITVIPGNYCDGFEHGSIRKHPNNDCNSYVDCISYLGKMYAAGNSCPFGHCIDFTLYPVPCVPCDKKTFRCEELTTPGPTTTLSTLPPGTNYVDCKDSTHFVGTTANITCIVLDNSFTSLNISFLAESNTGTEEKIGIVFPNGTIHSQSSSNSILFADFSSVPMVLSIKIEAVSCSLNGNYKITGMGTNSSFAPSVQTVKLSVIGNLTELKMHTKPIYPEGSLVEFNCTATLDLSHAEIKAYYKRQTESSFTEIPGSTEVIQQNASNCFASVVWKPSNPLIADAQLHNATFKCLIVKWPLADQLKVISVARADVAFDTYKIESNINSTVSMKCMARNLTSFKTILIRKINNNINETIARFSFPNSSSSINGLTVSHTNESMTVSITRVDCWDEGNYVCAVIKQDNSEVRAPAYLYIQPKNPPKNQQVILFLDPDIKENDYDKDKIHNCSGDVGYPDSAGYLSITFINPKTNASYTYDKKSISETMKTPLVSPFKFEVNLADGLSIIIKEDAEPNDINCTRYQVIAFLLKMTRDWNKATIRCSVKTDDGEITTSAAEEELYVIPKSVCDDTNGTDAYRPHEKQDGCRTYTRCLYYVPTGQLCQTNLCFDHDIQRCVWCRDVVCESEMIATTIGSTESTELSIVSTSTTAIPTPECPLQSCMPDLVSESETATLSCFMNTSESYRLTSIRKNGLPILTIYSNHTTIYHIDDAIHKYDFTIGASLVLNIKNVSCSDKSDYKFTLETSDGRTCSKSVSLELKVKPGTPTLTVDYRWEKGQNQMIHHCTGNVGNPAGNLLLEIKNGTSGNFTIYTPSLRSDKLQVTNCSNIQTSTFSIDFTSNDFKDHYIRCVANNTKTLENSETPPATESVLINPLPPYPCLVNGLHPYPGDCARFLNCANNVTAVFPCGNLCFKPTDSGNGHCASDCSHCNS